MKTSLKNYKADSIFESTLHRSLAFTILVIMVFVLTGCPDDSEVGIEGCTNPNATNYNPNATKDNNSCCLKGEDIYVQNVSIFDLNVNSNYYGKAISVFQFKQIVETTTGIGACYNMECNTNLVVKNLTNKTISYSYYIDFTLNAVHWTEQNAVTIGPGGSTDVGLVNSRCGRIDLGYMVILTDVISYN